MRHLQDILTAIGHIFLFKKPGFTRLDFIDLVIDDRPILLVAWQLKWATTVRIKSVSKKYRKKEGALLLHIPHNAYYIEIIASNMWRSKKETIYLKHIRLDIATSHYLFKQFKSLTAIHIKDKAVPLTPKLSSVTKVIIHLKPLAIRTRKTIRLKFQNFEYP